MVIPKNETLWVKYLNDSNMVTHVITSDKLRATYKLYAVKADKLEFTKHKSSDPRDLERWVDYGKD